MLRPSYWVFPIVSGVVWLATLLGLLLYWVVDTHRRRYPSMDPKQNIPYISDIGASSLKPLFIAGCVITTLFLDISFLSDRWLRHRGRLVPNSTTGEKALSALTIVFALLGTVGLILLSIYDTARHPRLHDVFLLLFIAGYILSAIFICWEYQRLGNRYRDHRILRTSFWIKLVFVIVEVILAIAFVSCTFTGNYDPAAVFEWIIAFIFSAYLFSFYVDLYPAVYTKDPRNLHRKEPQKSRYPAVMGAAMSQTELEEGRGGVNGTTSSNSEGNLTAPGQVHGHGGVVQPGGHTHTHHDGAAGDGYSNNF